MTPEIEQRMDRVRRVMNGEESVEDVYAPFVGGGYGPDDMFDVDCGELAYHFIREHDQQKGADDER